MVLLSDFRDRRWPRMLLLASEAHGVFDDKLAITAKKNIHESASVGISCPGL